MFFRAAFIFTAAAAKLHKECLIFEKDRQK